ncbi:MAG TPA: tRNA (adenosine(37)-N6)-threonylcarbamoyltransferase complex transferase subunit TsaD [Gemmatimonadaceae bacterium]|nr:tRNA (adenosine(37)-N6)-threonylcarbamoyltransferase complex transferase subunit TsaD [Gemmatimonadaceae bacterium]
MRVLGIETSCDETSAAVLSGAGDGAVIKSLVILSQDVHRIFGGVVPEIASRAHVTALVPVVERALADAGATRQELDAVAVTNGPGLVGALLVGVSFAKALAYALDVPVIGVHHMEGHLFATSLEQYDAVPPFTALLVSGGHTLLLDVVAWGHYRLLGRTRDDAAGEAFDKVAKLLGLPYPGGPAVEREASVGADAGDIRRYRFARPMLRRDQRPGDADYYDVSFSGLKTAVLNAVRETTTTAALTQPSRAAIASAFQDALIETLVEKTARALRQFKRSRVVLGGGVAGNRTLVAAMRKRCAELGARVFAPSSRLATDNAAMIARAGLFHLERGERSALDLNAFASVDLPGLAD